MAKRLERKFPGVLAVVEPGQAVRIDTSSRLIITAGWIFSLLALIIGGIGVTNTMAMSVFERTREIGLLRAVGMLRGQVTVMVLSEGVLVSVIGALLGMGLGIGLGAAGIFALKNQGVVLHIPLQLVLVLLSLGVVAGIISAAMPAWRAARTNVLEAIAGE